MSIGRPISYLKKIVLFTISILVISSCNKKEDNTAIFFKTLEKHYKNTEDFNKFSVSYMDSRHSPFQSYDYKNAYKSYSFNGEFEVEFDLTTKEYTKHSTKNFPGGFKFEDHIFKKDNLELSYDVNGVRFGKTMRLLNNRFNNTLDIAIEKIDFLNVRILLDAIKNKATVTTTFSENKAIITHMDKDSISKKYTFSLKPIQLISLENTNDNVKYNFLNATSKNGISYAKKVEVYEDHKFSGLFTITNLRKIKNINSSKQIIPDNYNLPKITKKGISEITSIAKDLYLISSTNQSRNMVIKITGKSITVFGAPSSDKLSESVIGAIESKFPNKTIDYVYITHGHSDHMNGLAAYAKHNVTILATPHTISAIKAYPNFKDDIASFKFSAIAPDAVINNVTFYTPEKDSHCKQQSFAYFNDSGIIYEGDFLEIPKDNTIATYMSEQEKHFIEFVRNKKLNIKRIIGHHRNSNISVATMDAYYAANTK